ncbi:MAG TPA: homogentisate 1,2-dioxygenase [Anaerolineales bacterium]|nr:homogentisate 1,2-dioxygenase [Anaerolineales bacterium]
MPYYHKLGQIPHKRHIQFKKPDGKLYREEVMGLEGFSSLQSILYHHFLPPRVMKTADCGPAKPEYVDFGPIRHRALRTHQTPLGTDPVSARIPLLGNNDVILGVSRAPKGGMDYFYRNSQAYETWWVHDGSGTLKSQFGNLSFRKGDYIVIPFGTTWKMELNEESKFFTIENPSQMEPPKRYRNPYGQLLEHAPFCERDIRVPTELETHTERGEFEVRVKVRDRISQHILDYHPFDVVGWDGYLYPWIFNIEDFEPITGRIHQPPPVHQTFEAHNFVVCSFVPRLFDYHPEGIPAPYNHSNIQSDEVIYYAEGNFMSRKGIDRSDISLHPFGLPHGPQPGMTEASIGKTETKELAVMVDTFHPLQLTKQALEMEKPYMETWLEGDGE